MTGSSTHQLSQAWRQGHLLASDEADGKSYVAVADQCHYQVAMYKWSDIQRAGRFSREAD